MVLRRLKNQPCPDLVNRRMKNQPCPDRVKVWMDKCAELKKKWVEAKMWDPYKTWGTGFSFSPYIFTLCRRVFFPSTLFTNCAHVSTFFLHVLYSVDMFIIMAIWGAGATRENKVLMV